MLEQILLAPKINAGVDWVVLIWVGLLMLVAAVLLASGWIGRLAGYVSTLRDFAQVEASGGIVLLLATFAALIWANSPAAPSYFHLLETQLDLRIGSFTLTGPLHMWINDGLMAVFFFVVGLEIKREVLVGELSSLRQATLPIAAAVGGMIVPALIYTLVNFGGAGAGGWGIPMATDIAFAVGVLALLGSRIPLALKVFLTALAIVDDIGAVLVIAIFYTSTINWTSLAVGAAFLTLLLIANRAGARHPLVYIILGLGLWAAFLFSGIHATIAGVLLALTIPARSRIDADDYVTEGRALLDRFAQAGVGGDSVATNNAQQEALEEIERATERVQTPLQRLEHSLHPWVTFVIMPLFALANAGIALNRDLLTALVSPVSLGVILGLVVGKQIGISLFSVLVVRLGWASLPAEVSWRQLYGASWLAGIGFTMSLFISSLAFEGAELLEDAKVGILVASLLAGGIGLLILYRSGMATKRERTTEG